jgi:hypothetical protein
LYSIRPIFNRSDGLELVPIKCCGVLSKCSLWFCLEKKKDVVQKDEEGIISQDEWYVKEIRYELNDSGDEDTMCEDTAYDNLYDEYFKNI